MEEHNNNGNWKVSQSEFKGYVKAKLEDMDVDIKGIKQELKNLNKFDKDLAIKVGSLGGGAGILGTILVLILKALFGI